MTLRMQHLDSSQKKKDHGFYQDAMLHFISGLEYGFIQVFIKRAAARLMITRTYHQPISKTLNSGVLLVS